MLTQRLRHSFGQEHIKQIVTYILQNIGEIKDPIFQRVDNAIQWINCYPAIKCQQNLLCYPPNKDLSSEYSFPRTLLTTWARFIRKNCNYDYNNLIKIYLLVAKTLYTQIY